jgi:cysteine-rich repeat protein
MRAAALVVLTGCSSLLGLDDNFHSPDAGATSHVGVTGVSRITYHSDVATDTVPEDLTGYQIDAYVVDDTGVHVYPGTVGADGTFAIPDVPARDYYLRVKTPDHPARANQIWHLDGHDVDLSTDRLGKRGTTPLDGAAPVKLSATAMRRYLSLDRLDLFSTLDQTTRSAIFTAGQPVLGVDHLTDATVDWRGRPALDASGLWVLHRRLAYDGRGTSLDTVVEVAHAGNLDQRAGQPLAVGLTFASGPTRQARVAINVPAVRTRNASQIFAAAQISAAPDAGAGLFGPFVMTYTTPTPPDTAIDAMVSYPDPFPDTWSRTAQLIFFTPVRQLDLLNGLSRQFGDLTLIAAVAAPGTAPAIPALTTPVTGISHVLLDGQPFADQVRAPAAPLRLSWDAIDGATAYEVQLTDLAPDGTSEELVITTAHPEAVLPGNTIADQHRLAISISVYHARPLEPMIRRPQASSTQRLTFAGLVLVSSTCGNGTVDPGEACDTRGETAACDYDCTAPRCGDGTRNAAAGEQCDPGFADGECDAQCHTVVCGDKMVAETEECDDGNTTPGDGCSPTCHRERAGRCGDGQLDFGEECDDGNASNTDACTTRCEAARCGDGFLQPGEQCDDGNPWSGDGCSLTCQTERCGDFAIVYPETCDDGNTTPGDGCSATCQRE